jgi:hypothetical protein
VSEHLWDDDQPMLDDLSEAFREAAPLAGTLAEYGKHAYAWRTVDQDLLQAALTFDSLAELVQERGSGPGESRVLTFTTAPMSLELEVLPEQVAGQIMPPGPGEVWVETPDGVTLHSEADDAGFFVLRNVPRGPVRLRCDTSTARLVTEWIHL